MFWFVFHCHGNEINISSAMAYIEGVGKSVGSVRV